MVGAYYIPERCDVEVAEGDYGSVYDNHSNMRWTGHITPPPLVDKVSYNQNRRVAPCQIPEKEVVSLRRFLRKFMFP